jgi:hypothetical protein
MPESENVERQNVEKITENVERQNVEKMTENVEFIRPLLTAPLRG